MHLKSTVIGIYISNQVSQQHRFLDLDRPHVFLRILRVACLVRGLIKSLLELVVH